MVDFLHIEKIKHIQDLNIKLSDILIDITSKLIKYSKTYDIDLPYEIKPLLEQAYEYMHELKHPTVVNKNCSICGKLNPDNADYCCYCGSSLIITRVRQSDKSPENATEPKNQVFNALKKGRREGRFTFLAGI